MKRCRPNWLQDVNLKLKKLNNMKKLISISIIAFLAVTAQAQTLKSAVGKYFLIGTAVNVQQTKGDVPEATKVLKKHFNSIVAENCMKGEALRPADGQFYWDDADRLVKFGADNKMAVIGHCLIWHSQPPKWFFTDNEGKLVSRDVLIDRMKTHIFTVMQRYKGKVLGWDVVNEAFEDDGTMRKSLYWKIIGPDYIDIAFKFAHQADPNAELYYNDFSMSKPGRRDSVCAMVRRMKACGMRIDGIGMQSHNGVEYPNLKEYEAAIDSFAATGVKVSITELDLNMLPNPKNFGGGANIGDKYQYDKTMNPYADGLTKEGEKIFNQRYLAFFDIYYRHRAQIERVTLWGINDGSSWLNNWPVPGRTNYPLLFDRNYQPKPVIKDIIKLFK
jgi:endo-1,4-beta-xylanase